MREYFKSILSQTRNLPPTPVLEYKTDTVVSLIPVDNIEYSIGGIVFQTSPVFESLTPSTTYQFYQRYIGETALSIALEVETNAVLGPPVDLLTNGTDYSNWSLSGTTAAADDTLVFTGDGNFNTAIYNLTNEVIAGQEVTLAIDVVSTSVDSTEDFGLSLFSISGTTIYIDCTTLENRRKYLTFNVADPIDYNRIRLITTLSMLTGENLVIENVALFDQLVDETNDPRPPIDDENIFDNGEDMSNWDTSDPQVVGSGDSITVTGDGTLNFFEYAFDVGEITDGESLNFIYNVDATTLPANRLGISSSSIVGATNFISSTTVGEDFSFPFTAANPITSNRMRLFLTDTATTGQNITISNLRLEKGTPISIPSTPTGVTAIATSNSVTVSWNASVSASSYDVEFDGVIYNTTNLSKVFIGLDPSTSYDYRVRAKNAAGDSSWSTLTSISTSAPSSGTDVTAYGAVADANYYDESSKRWRVSNGGAFATDNTTAFSNALNSGNNINIPQGYFLVNDNVVMSKALVFTADVGGVVRCDPIDDRLVRIFEIRADGTVIDGLTVESRNEYNPFIARVPLVGSYGSNKFAFQPEANNITIRNCTTKQMCRGIDRLWQTVRTGLLVDNCDFEDGSIPVFLHYLKDSEIRNCLIEMSVEANHPGLHSLYMAASNTNVVIKNCDVICKSTRNSGTLAQLVKTGYSGITLKNITIDGCTLTTSQPIVTSTGALDGLTVKNSTLNCTNKRSTNRAKMCQIKDYSYDVLFDNNTLNFTDGTTLFYDSGYALPNTNSGITATATNNTINVTSYSGTKLIRASIGQLWEGNTFNITSEGGSLLGHGTAKTTTFRNNTVIASGSLAVSVDVSSGGRLEIDDNSITAGSTQSYAIYNNNSNQDIVVTDNVFTRYNALSSSSAGITQSGNTFN